MNPQTILALAPGPDLDRAVNSHVFALTGDAPLFSTDETQALKLLDRLGLFVGRVSTKHPKHDIARPFVAGSLGFDPKTGAHVSLVSVTAASRSVALCKAALIVVLAPAKLDRPAREVAQESARAAASRIGTPAARGLLSGKVAAEKAQAKREADQLIADQREARRAKKALDMEARGVAAPRKAAKAARLAASPAPKRPAPPERTGPAQPSVAANYRRPLLPMPDRPKKFVEPQKINPGGSSALEVSS